MDLALENRIDTDPEKLIVVDPTPTGDSLLDRTLANIVAGDERDARFWVERTANHAQEIREVALSRLVANGILETRDDRNGPGKEPNTQSPPCCRMLPEIHGKMSAPELKWQDPK